MHIKITSNYSAIYWRVEFYFKESYLHNVRSFIHTNLPEFDVQLEMICLTSALKKVLKIKHYFSNEVKLIVLRVSVNVLSNLYETIFFKTPALRSLLTDF